MARQQLTRSRVPNLTETERDAIADPGPGDIIYNETNGSLEAWDLALWTRIMTATTSLTSGEVTGFLGGPLTVTATHSGSSHADVQAAAEATSATALAAHVATATDAHDASAVSIVASGFDGALNSSVVNAQILAQMVDDIQGVQIPVDANGFFKNLSPSVVNVQLLAQAVDNLPLESAVTSVNGLVGDVIISALDIDAIPNSARGVPSGVAELDVTGVLTVAQRFPHVSSINGYSGSVDLVASDVPIDAEAYVGGNLDNTVVNVQLLADAVNALTISGGGGGAPTDGTYLVTTASGSLSDEVVVGTTPGGELGGTWASPTVDSVHAGSSHASILASANAYTDAHVAAAGHTILSGGSPMTARGGLNLATPYFTVTDDAGNNETDVTLDAPLRSISDLANYADGNNIELAPYFQATATTLGVYFTTALGRSLNGIATPAEGRDILEAPEYVDGLRLTSTPGIEGTIVFDVDLNQGKVGGDTLTGGIAGNDNLLLQSTSHTTDKGYVGSLDPIVVYPTGRTHTTAELLYGVHVGNNDTITLHDVTPAGLANCFTPFNASGTIVFENEAMIYNSGFGYALQMIYKNSAGDARTMNTNYPFLAFNTYRADGAAVTNMGVQGFTDISGFDCVNGGSLGVPTHVGFAMGGGYGAGVSVVNRKGFSMAAFAGGGTVENQIGLDIGITDEGSVTNQGISSGAPIYVLDTGHTRTKTYPLDGLNIGGGDEFGLTVNGSAPQTFVFNDSNAGGLYAGNRFRGVGIRANCTFSQPGYVFGSYTGVGITGTVQNTSGVTVAMAPVVGMQVALGMKGNNAALTGNTYVGYADGSTFAGVSGGTYSGTYVSFQSNITTLAGGTMTTATAFSSGGVTQTAIGTRKVIDVADITGLGTLTDQIAIDIPVLSKASGLNLGIRCFANSIFRDLELYGSDLTFTTQQTFLHVDNTYTLNWSPAILGTLVNMSPTVLVPNGGNSFGTMVGFTHAPTVKSVSGGNVALGAIFGYVATPTLVADAVTGVSGVVVNHLIQPSYSVANSGTFNSGSVASTNIQSAVAVNAGATITSHTHITLVDASGAGSLATQIGLDIPAFAKATTNYGIRSLGTNVLTTIYGSTASGGDLTLGATNNATTGTIFLLDEVELRPNNVTFTAMPNWFMLDATYTMNFATAQFGTAFNVSPTVILSQGGNAFGTIQGYYFGPTVKTASGGGAAIGTIFGFSGSPIITADATTGTTGAVIMALLSPQFSVANSGTFSGNTTTNLQSQLTINTGASVATLTHILLVDAGGAGTLTTQIGIDIPAFAKGGTTNIGIRNKAITQLGGSAQFAVDASGNLVTTGTVTMGSSSAVVVSGAGDFTLANGVDFTLGTGTGTKIGTGITQRVGFYNVTPVAQQASANQASVGTTAPAGGTGTAAGGWSTAANRDTAITTINSLVTLTNEIRGVLVALGLMKGAA